MSNISLRLEDVGVLNIREGLNQLEIENKDLFWRCIQSLSTGNGEVFFRLNQKKLNTLKDTIWIGDISVPFSVREFYKKSIYTMLQESLTEEQIEQLFRLDTQIKSILDGCIIDANLPFNLVFDWRLDKLLKSQEINIEDNKNTSPFDKIEDVIHVASLMSEQRLLIAINTNMYFDQDYLNQLNSKLLAEGLNLLTINLVQGGNTIKDIQYNRCFVDNDYVIF